MLHENTQEQIKKLKEELEAPHESPSGVSVPTPTQTPPSLEDVLRVTRSLGENRDFIIKVILAVYVSKFLGRKDPVWLMLVGNPSSNKTTLVDLLKDLPDVYRLDTMTANPFSSGQRESENPKDLLPLLNNKCFVVKEYSTILGRNEEMVKQLISDLVAIYDGEYSKHSPTRGTVKYCSYFSHIGCVTPMALQKRHHYMNMIGARFLYLRIPPLSDEQRRGSLERMWDNREDTRPFDEARAVVSAFCSILVERAKREVLFPEVSRVSLNLLARLIARARGIVMTEKSSFQDEEDGHEVVHYQPSECQIEEPFRALKQLRKISAALAVIHGREEVSEEELSIVKMLALSSMPTSRAEVLSLFESQRTVTARKASELL